MSPEPRPGNHYNPNPEKTKALFEIADVTKLGDHLLMRYRDQFRQGAAWHVTYQPRVLLLEDAVETVARPWIKDPFFSRELEIRLAFDPVDPAACTGKFDTGADPAIGKMLTRIY
jgi:hypothetical protein